MTGKDRALRVYLTLVGQTGTVNPVGRRWIAFACNVPLTFI
jgi:hypothetical protein